LGVAAESPSRRDDFFRRFRGAAAAGGPYGRPVRLGDVPPDAFDAALFFRTLRNARPAALAAEERAALGLPEPGGSGNGSGSAGVGAAAAPPFLPLPPASGLRAGSVLLHARECGSTQEFMRAHSAGPSALAAQAAAQAAEGWPAPRALLPEGAVLVADSQQEGRGRGGNRWASPGGCLMFTCLRSLRIPGQLAPFVNYAVCLAVVEGAREAAAEAAVEALGARAAAAATGGAAAGADAAAVARAARTAADALPLRVKWPNDIYCSWDGPLGGAGGGGDGAAAVAADAGAAAGAAVSGDAGRGGAASPSLSAVPDPSSGRAAPGGGGDLGGGGAPSKPPVVKIGGALIHTTFSGGQFSVLTGVGLNLSNRAPTTCLDALLERALRPETPGGGGGGAAGRGGPSPPPPPAVRVRREALLAHVLARLDAVFASLEARGFAPLQERYLAAWLHSGQRLALEGPELGGPAPGSAAARAADEAAAAAAEDADEAGRGGGNSADDGGRRAVVTIVGLSPSGFLLGVDDAGGSYELTPDGNSLDMMAGLLGRRLPATRW